MPLTLKKLPVSRHPHEVEIVRYLSSRPFDSDPKNHCVPIFDVLDVPDDEDLKVLVMPLLRDFANPRFLTVGEAVEFFRQTLEVCARGVSVRGLLLTIRRQGLQFIHNHHVAHRFVLRCDFFGLSLTPS